MALRSTVPSHEIETLEAHLALALADPAIPPAKRDELAQRFAAIKSKLAAVDDPSDTGVGVPSRRILVRATGRDSECKPD
jgi:hypothetical protein